MSDLTEDRTIAFDDHGAGRERGHHAALVDVPKARLICVDSSQIEGAPPGDGVIHLTPGGEQTVGRGEICTYPIGSRKLSRQHARVFAGVGAWGVEDLNSTNGVRVNEEKVQTAWLKHGDIVRFGPIPFRFEVERPDMAATAAARHPAAPEGDGDDERTMLLTGAQGGKAAEVMLKVAREAEKAEEAPPAIVPTSPSMAASAAQAAPKGGDSRRVVVIGAAALAVIALAAGGLFYYPAFQKSREIAAIVDRGDHVVDRVITRSRDFSGAVPVDGAWIEDIKALQPVISESATALADNPDSRDLANLYARGRFLVFEREFTNLFNRPDPTGEFLKEASRKAVDLRTRLDKIARTLPPPSAGADQDALKAAADLADLAAILVTYRGFAREFPQIGKAGTSQTTAPTPQRIDEIESRKKDFIQYGKAYHQILTRDYRLFNTVAQDVENRDAALVGRWREALAGR